MQTQRELTTDLPPDLTDDEAIAMAMLIGCTFWCDNEAKIQRWFVWDDEEEHGGLHPLEQQRYQAWRALMNKPNQSEHWGWDSKATLARDYLTWWRAGAPTT